MADVVYKSLLLNSINHFAYCNARIECTKDDKMNFEKTTIQLRLAESIYLKTNKNARTRDPSELSGVIRMRKSKHVLLKYMKYWELTMERQPLRHTSPNPRTITSQVLSGTS